METTKGHHNNFDLLRFLFAAMVVYSHSFPLLLGHKGYAHELFSWMTRGQITGGMLAVDAFFAISGYLILNSWMRSRGLGSYLKKRVLRIYPGFLAACVVCILLLGPLGATSLTDYWTGLSLRRCVYDAVNLNVSSGHGIFAHNPMPGAINGSDWTIIYEFYCYLFLAVLGVLGVYRRPGILLTLFVSILIVNSLQVLGIGSFHRAPSFIGFWPVPFAGHWPRLIAFFMAGACFYAYRDRIPNSRRCAALSLVLLSVCAAAGFGLQIVLPVAGTYLLIYLAFHPGLRLHNFARRGDLSYGVYLYAWPIQQLLVMYFAAHLNPYTLFLTSLAITCGFAAASWRWVEKPALAFKKPRPQPPALSLETLVPSDAVRRM